jgi:hypothetical protein
VKCYFWPGRIIISFIQDTTEIAHSYTTCQCRRVAKTHQPRLAAAALVDVQQEKYTSETCSCDLSGGHVGRFHISIHICSDAADGLAVFSEFVMASLACDSCTWVQWLLFTGSSIQVPLSSSSSCQDFHQRYNKYYQPQMYHL